MAIEIVDFPIKNGDFFQFAMLNYQRVLNQVTRWDCSKDSPHGPFSRQDSEEITEMASQERPKVSQPCLTADGNTIFVDRETFLDSMDMQ